jgi:hypothetical protein
MIAFTTALAADEDRAAPANQAVTEPGPVDFGMGAVFGAVTINGMNYQQIGLRPELTLWKLGIGLDIHVLLDDEGKVRQEDWDEWEDYLDKMYYIRFGHKGDLFYFRYGGLDWTSLGFGTLIYGYSNMLEYPTYKRQGLDLGINARYGGIEMVINDFKELNRDRRGFMGGGRVFVKPFRRLQFGASIAGDINEYNGLRDTDGDGYPDEIDAYPDNDNYATEIDRYRDKGIDDATIDVLVAAGLLSPLERADLQSTREIKSRTSFWAVDAGLKVLDFEYFKMDIYAQFAQNFQTGGWGYAAPGVRIETGSFIELYADYRQQSDEFIFNYYNNTYDLERAKYVDDGTGKLTISTKKDSLKNALESKGYMAGLRLNFFNVITGKAEYQNMHWGNMEDKSIRGELALNKNIIPLITKAKAYYVQNNVEKLRWKTEGTVMSAVLGIGLGEGVSVDITYLVTFQDKNGDGEIKEDDETITNVSVSTSAMF